MKKNVANNELRSKKIFAAWALVGPFLVLIGIILETHKVRILDLWQFEYSIIYEFIKNIGVAITISSIFTFIIGTQEFIEFIKEKLISIIISKEFIKRLNRDERRDLLKVILKPTKELSEIYSGISKYLNSYIDDSLLLFNKHFRSGYSIYGEAYIDKITGRMTILTDMNYRIYKVMGEYEHLAIGFEDEDAELVHTKIYSPAGDEYTDSSTPIEDKDKITDDFLKKDPAIQQGSKLIIPENFRKHDQLDVSRRIIEHGQDHWHLYSYRATLPCDKFTLTIKCAVGIEVKKCVTYGPSENFKIVNEGNKIFVVCNDWIKPGLGVSILFAEINNNAHIAQECLDIQKTEEKQENQEGFSLALDKSKEQWSNQAEAPA